MGGPEGLSEVSLPSPHTQASLSSQPCPPPPGAGQSLPPTPPRAPTHLPCTRRPWVSAAPALLYSSVKCRDPRGPAKAKMALHQGHKQDLAGPRGQDDAC